MELLYKMDESAKNFWKKYEKANFLNRRESLKKLQLVDFILNFHLFNKESLYVQENAILTQLQPYFDDAIGFKE